MTIATRPLDGSEIIMRVYKTYVCLLVAVIPLLSSPILRYTVHSERLRLLPDVLQL